MKTTKRHFNLFKKYFLGFQKQFELNNYQTYFYHEGLRDSFARIIVDQPGHCVRITFATKWRDRPLTEVEIKKCALHEACHLLIHKLCWLATCRYLDKSEISEADEELVVKLTNILEK